ncbi:MAG: DUF433 domain-containing protein [Anaerolineae bacterium]|nr:DUF433 domain-containing protein [Anaerolineae bacterium]
MIMTPIAIDLPLRTDEGGIIRVGDTRVTLDSVIADFNRGMTPDEIVRDFSVLKIADVYQVIGYYLANQAEVDTYIRRQRDEAERIRREWEAEHPPQVTKSDLEARRKSDHES